MQGEEQLPVAHLHHHHQAGGAEVEDVGQNSLAFDAQAMEALPSISAHWTSSPPLSLKPNLQNNNVKEMKQKCIKIGHMVSSRYKLLCSCRSRIYTEIHLFLDFLFNFYFFGFVCSSVQQTNTHYLLPIFADVY